MAGTERVSLSPLPSVTVSDTSNAPASPKITTGFRTERYFWRLAQLIRWNINRDLTFTEEFEFFPRVGDLVNHRYRAEANLAYQLIKNLSLNFTVMAEADPQQLNDFVPDDVQIRSSLGWRF